MVWTFWHSEKPSLTAILQSQSSISSLSLVETGIYIYQWSRNMINVLGIFLTRTVSQLFEIKLNRLRWSMYWSYHQIIDCIRSPAPFEDFGPTNLKASSSFWIIRFTSTRERCLKCLPSVNKGSLQQIYRWILLKQLNETNSVIHFLSLNFYRK